MQYVREIAIKKAKLQLVATVAGDDGKVSLSLFFF